MILEENIYLKDYTSYKTGGMAKYFAMCYNNDDVRQALEFANSNKLDYEVIGGGSNLLVSDDGYNGLIICTAKLNRYIINYGNNIIKCGAGINLADLVYYTCSHGFSGMESMADGARKIHETGLSLGDISKQVQGSIDKIGSQIDLFIV